MKATGTERAILLSLAADIGIAAAKFAGAGISGSNSLLAEAVHSCADSVNELLLLVGRRRGRRAPSAKHPLGHQREAFFWSLMVAILLFTVGGIYSVYRGLRRWGSREPLENPVLGFVIVAVSVLLEGIALRSSIKEIRRSTPGISLPHWFKHTARADLLVIFTQDAAAIVGLGIAAISLGLAYLTGNPEWDAAGSVGIGLLLGTMGLLLASEIKSLLIGEAPPHSIVEPVTEIVRSVIPGGRVGGVLAVRVGPEHLALNYRIHPGMVGDVGDLIRDIHEIKARVVNRFPAVKWQYVEPDDTL